RWASGCCPTRAFAAPPIRTRPHCASSNRRIALPPTWAAGIRRSTARSASRAGPDRSVERSLRRSSGRRQRAQPEAKLRNLDVALGVEIAALPLVGNRREHGLGARLSLALDHPAPREVVVDVEHVRRVRLGEGTLAAHDDEVLVVVERR